MQQTAILRRFGPDPDNWVRRTSADHDVVVVGAGQAGLGIGFALRRAGIGRAAVVDAAAPGETGGWMTTARMHTLRTPKIWPQPEYGHPELSFRAWYERLHGEAAYDIIENIPRTVWAQYVAWFGCAVDVPVRHHTRLVGVAPASDHLVLRLAVRGSDGRTLSSRITLNRSATWAVGATSLTSTSFSISIWSRMAERSVRIFSSSSAESRSRARCATCSTSAIVRAMAAPCCSQ